MYKKIRIKKIKEILESKEFTQEEMMWEGSLKLMKVYDIPLGLLIYDKNNSRISNNIKSFEQREGEIDAESIEGKDIIEKFLWESAIQENEEMFLNIEENGQMIAGLITKEGFIVEGNRTAMLLNIANNNNFKAIILH